MSEQPLPRRAPVPGLQKPYPRLNSRWQWLFLAVLVAGIPFVLVASAAVAAPGRQPATPVVPEDGRLGGDLTVVSRTSRAFGLPGPTLSAEERALFLTGDTAFEATFVAGAAPTNSGLGPHFNNASCAGCHVGDGRGQPVVGSGARRSQALVRVSLPAGAPYVPGGPAAVPGLGTQVRDHATFGVQPDAGVALQWQTVDGQYADGTPYQLRTPSLTITLPDGTPLGPEVLRSLRVTPPSFGRGLLEAVPEAAILALADPEDRDGDGISGRPNWVWDVPNAERRLGRFGLKANVAGLPQQVAQAYSEDMGITNPMFPATDGSTEIDQSTLDAVIFYVRTLAVPARRTPSAEARAGEALFVAAGCTGCHTPSVQTGPGPIRALANQTIYPYSDLLLHDLGAELADGRPDFEASGTEWRTPPLWGIGLTETVAGASSTFLHDGRARSLDEAILWHGGEAEAARNWFVQATAEERARLIAFLRSL
ncbi:MAG: c-type cytochrome [Chloroflexi bacterium]|nr:c-type cytochrome [Chloroflexota bacterium]